MVAVLPAFKSDNLFIQKQVTNVALLPSTSLRFLEMPFYSNAKIQFHFLVPVTLKDRTLLKEYLRQILKREGRVMDELSFIFCSDEYLLDINKTYLRHNYFTDIITFDLSDERQQSGEIYISVDRVRDNARQLKLNFQEELHRVIFHGILHLSGYGDKNAAEQSKMRRKEDQYIKAYFR